MNLKEAIEVLKDAKYIGSDEYVSDYDKRMNEAIDTVVSEVEKPTYTVEDMDDFAEWCMKNYKRMHDMNEYKERFDNDPSGKRYNISNLRELWKKERKDKESRDKVEFLRSANKPSEITHPYDLSRT